MRRRAFLGGVAALAAASSLRARPRDKVRCVGFLAHGVAKALRRRLAEALGKLGWRDGENLRFEYAVAGGDAMRWDAVSRALVGKECDLIVVVGTHMALRAMRATKTTPLVMMMSGYPIEAGVVPSLSNPGGNITGMRTFTDALPSKWIKLMRELVPSLRVLGEFDDYVPPFSNDGEIEAGHRVFARTARALGIELRRWKVQDEAALTRAIAEAEGAGLDALWVTGGAIHGQPDNRARIRELVIRRRLPMACDLAGSVFRGGGGLMAYSADWNEIAERTASFVDRILKGARPADMPIEQPTRFELVLNVKNANAIGYDLPKSLLFRADRVIE